MSQLSEKIKGRLERERAAAHQRVVERGIVQFRADQELMRQLLAISDHRKTAVGVLVRSWIAPIVKQEYGELKLKHIMLPSGKVLTPNSSIRELQKACTEFENGQLDLLQKQIDTIQDWLCTRHGIREPSEVKLADGRRLTINSSYKELIAVYEAHKNGELNLRSREYNAIVDWTIRARKRRAKAG